jgi:CysZ protein
MRSSAPRQGFFSNPVIPWMKTMLLIALFKAFAQLGDPALRRVMWRGLAMAAALFIALLALASWGLSTLAFFDIEWLNWIVAGLGGLGAVFLAWLLFPGAMVALQGLLLDDAAEAVERRYYPDVAAKSAPLRQALNAAMRLAVLTIVLNLLALPFYIFAALLTPFIYYGLNGYLFGREYFEMVALRRMDPTLARAMRQRHGGTLFIAGVVIAGLFSIPIVGWFMPAVAAAFMVHVFEALRRHEQRL